MALRVTEPVTVLGICIQIAANNRRRKDIYTLPRADQELLSNLGYKQKLAEVDKAILANAEFLKQIVADTQIFGGDFDEEGEDAEDGGEGGQPGPSHTHTHSHGY